MPAALRSNPLGLHHPAATPMPQELRSAPQRAVSAAGERRVSGGKQSAYVSPLGARAERRGELVELRAHVAAVRVAVDAGGTLLEAVADGTLWGWRTREALSHALGEPLANWDRQPGRTRLERVALVERVLAELGVVHRGGWQVSR